MPTYPNLVRYLQGDRRPVEGTRTLAQRLPLLVAKAVALAFFLLIVRAVFWFVYLPGPTWLIVLLAILLTNSKSVRAAIRDRVSKPFPNSTPEELDEMERGAAAWNRIRDALRQTWWSGSEVGEARRSAGEEVRESADHAMNRLVYEPMSREDRAWLAFGLERLAEELVRRPSASLDHIGYAIHNRQALRMANELTRKRREEP